MEYQDDRKRVILFGIVYFRDTNLVPKIVKLKFCNGPLVSPDPIVT